MVEFIERRRFFRVEDQLIFDYQPVDEQLLGQPLLRSTPLDSELPGLEDCDRKLHGIMSQLAVKSPLAAEAIELLDQKLNMAIQRITESAQVDDELAAQLQSVSIGACGMALELDREFASGDALEIKMTLMPSHYRVHCRARVVQSEPGDDLRYLTRLEFCDLDSRDQEVLIQHAVRRQAELLKHRYE